MQAGMSTKWLFRHNSHAARMVRERSCPDTGCGHAECSELRESEAPLSVATAHSLRVAFAVCAARMGGERVCASEVGG